jgi:hypothetical protein
MSSHSRKRAGPLSIAAIVALLASCTEEGSSRPIPERLISAFGGYDVTEYGYCDGLKYEASVNPDDLDEGDTIASAMLPIRAVELARPALEVTGRDPSDFHVCGVNLIPHAHRNKHYYVVLFCLESESDSIGFRIPVLLSGQVIQPQLSDDQS